jgi:DNA-binding beta-propeller fold protein YncE
MVIRTIPLDSSQRDVAINPNTNIAYATLYEHSMLSMINGLTNAKWQESILV